jgi:aspartyl aminopeptidase
MDSKGACREELICLDDMPVVIPQLAIHLDRNINDSGLILNKQEHLAALASIEPLVASKTKKTGDLYLQRRLKSLWPKQELLSFDLFLYPLEKARLIGEHQNLLASYRIDNLASTHAALSGLIRAKQPEASMLKTAVFWDNEEIGSNTAQGANSPFLTHIIERITLSGGFSRETYLRLLNNSLCASVDLAHAFHPGYPEKHEPRHLALLNRGIVLKSSAQHRYASDARTSGTIAALCKNHKIPFQQYVSRGDIPCGTTVGPIHAGLTGMPTVDIGCAQLSMHASRELTGIQDHLDMCRLLEAFFNRS